MSFGRLFIRAIIFRSQPCCIGYDKHRARSYNHVMRSCSFSSKKLVELSHVSLQGQRDHIWQYVFLAAGAAVISIVLDDTSPGVALMNILAAAIVAHVATFVAWALSYFSPTVGRSCSVGNQARGGQLAGRKPTWPTARSVAYRDVTPVFGPRTPPAPRLPYAPKPSACIDRLPGRLHSRGLHSRDRLTHSRIAANCCLVNCDSGSVLRQPNLPLRSSALENPGQAAMHAGGQWHRTA